MNLSQLLAVLLARWRTVVLIPVVALVLAALITWILPAKYSATSTVVVDSRASDPLVNMTLPGMAAPSYMATQMDILMSEHVAIRVAQLLRLNESPQLQDQWRSETGGQGSFDAWLASWLRQSLKLRPSKDSNVVSISYEAREPRFAVAVANAFAQAYIETNVGLRVSPAKQASSFFDERLAQARAQLEAAQSKLSKYQKDNGIITSDERLDVETARLNELSTQLVALRALSAEANSRASHGNARDPVLSDVLMNPVVSGLTAELNRNEARLQELRARYGEAHPQVRETQANISTLRQRIDAESQRVLRSVSLNNTINQARESEVRAAYDAQRTKVLRLKEQRDEMAVLEKDVENSRRNYELMQTRAAQVSLESQNSTPNVSLLGPATLPNSPSFPSLFVNLLAAGAIGTVLGLAVALYRELRDRRIRTADDVVYELELPLLAEMPGSEKPRLPWRRRAGQPQWLLAHAAKS